MEELWNINTGALVGKFCRAETIEGVVREGKITHVQTFDFGLNGEPASLPVRFELNGDSADTIDFTRLTSLTIK